MEKIVDLTHLDRFYLPRAIHGWKAMDLSFHLPLSFRDSNNPTSRENFDDTLAMTPKLILTLCHTKDFHFVIDSN